MENVVTSRSEVNQYRRMFKEVLALQNPNVFLQQTSYKKKCTGTSDVDKILSSNIVSNLLICNDKRPCSKSQIMMRQSGSSHNDKYDNIYRICNIRHIQELPLK